MKFIFKVTIGLYRVFLAYYFLHNFYYGFWELIHLILAATEYPCPLQQ